MQRNLDLDFTSPPRINFDTASYDEARLIGAHAYREFREALAYPENADPAETGPKDYSPYDGRTEEARRKTLSYLPPAGTPLPLRSLARLGGHASWGDLEVFYQQPTLPHDERPASEALRRWYSTYIADFDTYFPEHREPNLAGGLEIVASDFVDLPTRLEAVTSRYAQAASQSLGRVTLLGVLLRDYAAELRWLAETLDFSIDANMRLALVSKHRGDSLPETFLYYEEILKAEGLAPGPGPMLAAIAIRGVPEIDFALPKHEILPALRKAMTSGEGDAAASTLPASPAILGHANSDQPTEHDRIGVQPLVEGLCALLDDERTGLALSIGITAPWGGGKSSVMRQLRAALIAPRPGRTREWIPIRFDAWKYERSERLWAALSKAIYEQSLEPMSATARTWFKFRLEGARRGWFSFLVLPLLIATLLVIGGTLLAFHVSAAAGVLTVAATVIGFSGFAATVWGFLTDPFKRALAGYTSDPSYEEQLGFTSDADADIRSLTEQLTEGANRALVVFVDDLDRCSPRHVVEAVEAINQIFNASEEGRCVFILGMDRDLIAASIEVAYAETIAQLPDARQANFGLHFLAKLVQLSVAVPPPGPEGIERLLDSIGDGLALRLPKGGPFYTVPRRRGPDGERIGREPNLDQEPEELSPQTLDFDLEEPGVAPEVDESSPDFHLAERLAVRYLDPNPREVKRFDNAFRLQLRVASRTPGCELDFSKDDLIAIGGWVAMRLRWPDLAVAIDRDEELLGRLERAANDGAASTDEPWCSNPKLTELLREELPNRRIARLQNRTFLRIS